MLVLARYHNTIQVDTTNPLPPPVGFVAEVKVSCLSNKYKLLLGYHGIKNTVNSGILFFIFDDVEENDIVLSYVFCPLTHTGLPSF